MSGVIVPQLVVPLNEIVAHTCTVEAQWFMGESQAS